MGELRTRVERAAAVVAQAGFPRIAEALRVSAHDIALRTSPRRYSSALEAELRELAQEAEVLAGQV